jgi:hypothetical protein
VCETWQSFNTPFSDPMPPPQPSSPRSSGGSYTFWGSKVLADEKMGQLARDVHSLITEFAHDELLERLVSTAAIIRARDEYISEQFEGMRDGPYKEMVTTVRTTPCGTLQEDTEAHLEGPWVSSRHAARRLSLPSPPRLQTARLGIRSQVLL